jgi:hypothetical protein
MWLTYCFEQIKHVTRGKQEVVKIREIVSKKLNRKVNIQHALSHFCAKMNKLLNDKRKESKKKKRKRKEKKRKERKGKRKEKKRKKGKEKKTTKKERIA